MNQEFSNLRQKAGLTIEDLAELTGSSSRTIYRWENGDTRPNKLVVDILKQRVRQSYRDDSQKRSKFSFIDLFAGIGGMRMGFESVGGKCVFTSEWNKFSRQTYLANHGSIDHTLVGDITKINAEEIPSHDVLLAGFPCQPFSLAGVSKKNSLGTPHGFECNTQGTLFFDIERILTFHRPAAFLLENVKNLLSHDKGKTFEIIRATLEDKLDYHIKWSVIDARAWLPQHRERIFIVGTRKDTGFSFDSMPFPNKEMEPRLATILHPEDGSEEAEPPYTEGLNAIVSNKYTLSTKLWNYLKAYAEKHRLKGNGFGYGLNSPSDIARTLSARYHKDGSEILIRQTGRKRPRRLTPRECARLMGYDGPGKPLFEIPVSDTQAYRQFGNGVAVPVVEAVARHMLPHILINRKKDKNQLKPNYFRKNQSVFK